MAKINKDHDDMNWETLESEYLFNRPWLTVRRDTVRLPNGKVNPEYYVLEYPTWVNVTAITEDGEFVFIRQYRHGMKETRYEIVAGCAEAGEQPEEAARRELLEETGYTGGKWTLLSTLSQNPSTCSNLTYCFLAEGVRQTESQHLDETEDIQITLLSRDEVLQLLLDDELKQALMVAPLWKYFYSQGR
ncbi:MAG: NUDIX hydrolase [Bacteroidaceae bacterium]|nr:NUDIX hydrolase [Bacteroidaceae bacterium]